MSARTLARYLETLEPGPIEDLRTANALLFEAWPDLVGSDNQKMASYKLARFENPEWHPPFFTFEIERHGAVVLGSIDAEVQTWQLDVEQGTAEIVATRGRRIGKAAARLDVKPLAREVADLILASKDDPRITWRADRLAVKVNVSAILPPGRKQTYEGRVKRFHANLGDMLAGSYARAGAWYRKENR